MIKNYENGKKQIKNKKSVDEAPKLFRQQMKKKAFPILNYASHAVD